MATEDLQSWSVTAGNNANADAGINWAEGQARASVNNSARSMMAAHAKDRNLRNGSITTAGTANVQTFSSGVSYTGTVPTGLTVKLKVGVGLTNTAAMTLNMDAIGAVAVKDMAGRDPTGGAFTAGRYVDLVYNGTNWILLLPNNAVGGIPECGRLETVSATLLSFKPFKGDLIKVNGQIYNIPSAGITGMANTGVFLNGAGGQNLAASSLYYVYCFDNAGVLTADYSTTGHGTSVTAGNAGTEVKSADDTRSLIGLVFTNGSSQFANTLASRTVISWFNRRRVAIAGAGSAGATSASASIVEITASSRVLFLTWATEAVEVVIGGTCQNNVVDGLTITNIGLDGALTAQISHSSIAQHHAVSSFEQISGGACSEMTEGLHFLTPIGNVSGGGTGAWFAYIVGSIRG
jgi:hypothetical protein